MNLKIVFDDNSSKEINYSGKQSFFEWAQKFFDSRYFVLNDTSDIGNCAIDTYKVKYIDIIKT